MTIAITKNRARATAPPSTDLATLDDVKPPLIKPGLRPWAIAFGLMATSVAADQQYPLIVTSASALAAWSTVQVLHRRYRRDDPDDVREARHKRTRMITYAAGAWSAWGGWCDWQDPGTGITVAMGGLFVGTVVAALPYWKSHGVGITTWSFWTSLRGSKTVEVIKPTEDPSIAEAVALMEAINQRWAARVASRKGALKDSDLRDVEPIPGGWRGTVEFDDDAELDNVEKCAGKIARAYRIGLTSVTFAVDPEDAGVAEVRVFKVNSLALPQLWNGEGIREDGTSLAGRYIGGSDVVHYWWDETGAWIDALFGASRSGKSEFLNLLLTIAARHRDPHTGEALIESIVIDPQNGQSFGALVKTFSRFVTSIEDAREALGQVVAEMYRRNKALAEITWLNDRGDTVTGMNNWRPGLDGMKLLLVVIDECHIILADEVCKGHVEKIANMAGKCGIKLQLATQSPVMASIGNSSKIKEAAGGGNLYVMRTGSSISAQLAAGGRLPGNPHNLPRRWSAVINGVKTSVVTAGIGYSTGAESVPELMRTLWVGEYPMDWLYDGQVLLYPPAVLDLPDPVKPAIPSAQANAEEVGADGMSNKDHLAAFFMASTGAQVTLEQLINHFPAMKESTMMWGLRTLVKENRIIKIKPGVYELGEEREVETQE